MTTKPRTLSDLSSAVLKLKDGLKLYKDSARGAVVRETLGPIIESIANDHASAIEVVRQKAAITRRMLADPMPPAPERNSAEEISGYLKSIDPESRVVEWLVKQRAVDRFEQTPEHLRVQTLANDVDQGRYDRLLAVAQIDRDGEIVPTEALERLLVERGRRLRPKLAQQLDAQEQEIADTISICHERAVEASRLVQGLGVDVDELVDRGSFIGSPRRPATLAEAERLEAEAEPKPAA